MTGQEFYTYRATAVAILLLAYSYPTKGSWIRAVERYGNARRTSNPARAAHLAGSRRVNIWLIYVGHVC